MKYAYSTDEEHYYGEYDSREEAAIAVFAEDEDAGLVWTGIIDTPPRAPSAERLIENVAENTTEEAGEWSDDYLQNAPAQAVAELQAGLQRLWDEWEAKYHLEPDWFNVSAIREHRRSDFEEQLKQEEA